MHDDVVDLIARWALDRGIRDRGSVASTDVALNPHRVTAEGKLLTLTCRGLSIICAYSFFLTLLSNDCGMSLAFMCIIIIICIITNSNSATVVNHEY